MTNVNKMKPQDIKNYSKILILISSVIIIFLISKNIF